MLFRIGIGGRLLAPPRAPPEPPAKVRRPAKAKGAPPPPPENTVAPSVVEILRGLSATPAGAVRPTLDTLLAHVGGLTGEVTFVAPRKRAPAGTVTVTRREINRPDRDVVIETRHVTPERKPRAKKAAPPPPPPPAAPRGTTFARAGVFKRKARA